MKKLSLMDKIRKYVLQTNSITLPTNEEDAKLFEEILKSETTSKHEALNLAELRQLANEIKEQEIKACLEFYADLAKDLGIACTEQENM